MLEDEFAVSDAEIFGILCVRRDVGHLIGEALASGVLDGNLLQQGSGKGFRDLSPGNGDGFSRTGDLEIVSDRNGELRRSSWVNQRNGYGENEGKEAQGFHEALG